MEIRRNEQREDKTRIRFKEMKKGKEVRADGMEIGDNRRLRRKEIRREREVVKGEDRTNIHAY